MSAYETPGASAKDCLAVYTMLMNMQDLSFNNLEGEIPNLVDLVHLERCYLTSNLLTGNIPDWIKSRDTGVHTDLSYNNFSESSAPPGCPENLNLFRSFSGKKVESGHCLTRFPCTKDWYEIHINCGGGSTMIGNTVYEADNETRNSAKFSPQKESWGTSITGNFWDLSNITLDDYTARNVSVLSVKNSELYTEARLSPLSVSYYGRCLANGKYNVTLHFAEIIFRHNRSYQSLGRRMFDVYIQDEKVLEDFDIEHVAGGVDKAVTQTYQTVVKDKTLDIRFHWAGKGTSAIPRRGMNGPLISAISMKANFKPPPDGKTKVFIAVGVAALVLCIILTVLLILWWKGCMGGSNSREQGGEALLHEF
ncbi:unnamed protein product [Ilex paraguariensis]|uniref:Malectin domain-containing protein n=1 Tax=Ilex paraguariensis TaxID=185542 RepID=A0ABC8RST9_9AQUA